MTTAMPTQSETTRRPSRRTLVLIAVVLAAILAVGAIVWALIPKAGGRGGAEQIATDYLTALSEGRVADALALEATNERTLGDPAQMQTLMDGATERISGITIGEATEIQDADIPAVTVPFSYTLAEETYAGEFLVVEGADGTQKLKMDNGAFRQTIKETSVPEIGLVEEFAYDVELPPALLAGQELGPGGAIVLPGVYPVESQSPYAKTGLVDQAITEIAAAWPGSVGEFSQLINYGAIEAKVDTASDSVLALANTHFEACSAASGGVPTDVDGESCGLEYLHGSTTDTWYSFDWSFDAPEFSYTPNGENVTTVAADGTITATASAVSTGAVDITTIATAPQYLPRETRTDADNKVAATYDVKIAPDGTVSAVPTGSSISKVSGI